MELLIDSNIKDEFNGWSDGKIFELDDGTKWKLSSYTLAYKYSYRPKAKIWQDNGSYYLEVEGMGEKVPVIRI